MKRVSLNVEKQFCEECSLALRRFIGNMDGVETIEVRKGTIDIDFDPSRITGNDLISISKDSLEKLGYRLLDTNE
ncbi:MAG TPA: hypothetical protein DCO77_03775 [Nitrospiraceae bacterium]|nr:hypothetical protein [Nitrospiraceae bacterium]